MPTMPADVPPRLTAEEFIARYASVPGAELVKGVVRLPGDPAPPPPAGPILVVLMKSPTDLWTGVFAKLAEYLAAGARFVVLIDPAKSTVSVYHGSEQDVLGVNDTLTLPDVLPGFRVPVASLFA